MNDLHKLVNEQSYLIGMYFLITSISLSLFYEHFEITYDDKRAITHIYITEDIECNIESASYTTSGVLELRAAVKYQRRSRIRVYLFILIILIIVALVIALPLYFTMRKKQFVVRFVSINRLGYFFLFFILNFGYLIFVIKDIKGNTLLGAY